MVALAPPVLIDPPGPHLQQYGLFSVANGPTNVPDLHAIAGGLQWQPDVCGDTHIWPSACGTTPTAKAFDGGDTSVTALPFRVYATLNCGSLGYRWQEFADRVRNRLENKEQQGVELAFWGGTTDQPGWLQTHTTSTLADVTNIVTGLGRLEEAIDACYGLQATIHVPTVAAAHLAEHHLAEYRNGILYTLRGNRVSIGAGYANTGPANEAPVATGGWMYATGPVWIWRSPDILVPNPQETFNRTGNQQMLLAERDYLLAAECCAIAIEVTNWEGAF